jgi:hypothetical protein
MSNPRPSTQSRSSAPRHFVLAPRNLIILAAAVILVFGYCVLFPIGIAL